MKLIVGLGNPGAAYQETRHNLGFMVADAILDGLGVKTRIDRENNCLKARIDFKQEEFVLCKPQTYMNLSGSAVEKLSRKHKLKPADILVICDDTHLELGRIKIKAKGSPGGHKGLESVSRFLKSDEFNRLRIGISSPPARAALNDYVLSRFLPAEERPIRRAVEEAKETALCWLENGIEEAMNKFN